MCINGREGLTGCGLHEYHLVPILTGNPMFLNKAILLLCIASVSVTKHVLLKQDKCEGGLVRMLMCDRMLYGIVC